MKRTYGQIGLESHPGIQNTRPTPIILQGLVAPLLWSSFGPTMHMGWPHL
jgi:hypothetical protein